MEKEMRTLEWGGYRSREEMLGDLFAGTVESVGVDETDGRKKGSLQIWRKSEGLFECEFHTEEEGAGEKSFWGICEVPMKEPEVAELLLQVELGMPLREILKKRNVTRVGGRALSWWRIILYALIGAACYALGSWMSR